MLKRYRLGQCATALIAFIFSAPDAFSQSNNCNLNFIEAGSKRWDAIMNCDDANNRIEIDGRGGQIVEFMALGNTRINGKQVVVKNFVGNLDDISVNLGGGDDYISIRRLNAASINSKLVIQGRSGDDYVLVNEVNFKKVELKLNSGSGNTAQSAYLFNSIVNGTATLDGGEYDDVMAVHDINPTRLKMTSRSGDDTINVSSVRFYYNMDVETGSGDDQVQLHDVYGYTNTGTARMRIMTDRGSDQLVWSRSGTRYGEVEVNLGRNNDSITFGRSFLSSANPPSYTAYNFNYFHLTGQVDCGRGTDSLILENNLPGENFDNRPAFNQAPDNGEIQVNCENLVNF